MQNFGGGSRHPSLYISGRVLDGFSLFGVHITRLQWKGYSFLGHGTQQLGPFIIIPVPETLNVDSNHMLLPQTSHRIATQSIVMEPQRKPQPQPWPILAMQSRTQLIHLAAKIRSKPHCLCNAADAMDCRFSAGPWNEFFTNSHFSHHFFDAPHRVFSSVVTDSYFEILVMFSLVLTTAVFVWIPCS